jgi:NAD(P)-dependent dehydrogenase (short-subunit alcohol dehydrogenase family)
MALEDKATKDGYDVQMQTNHLSHFLLTRELFPLLQKAKELRGEARIVNHSSMARKGGPLQAKYLEKNGGNLGGNGAFFYRGARWERYHQTKLANALFSYVSSEKLQGSGIKALCVAPGLAQTGLQVTTGADGGMKGAMWTMYMAQSAEDGTMPLLHACFGEAENGTFWEPANGFSGLPVLKDFDKHCKDSEQQKILWETSEQACGPWSL